MTVKQAASTAGVSTVYITNRLGDDTIDHGYIYDVSEEDRGQKVVVLNQKWFVFFEQTLSNQRGKMQGMWVQKSIARTELGITDGQLTQMLIDGMLSYDSAQNKIKKDDKYYRLLERSER